ncbi:MAG: formylglycine-generating enzyme family protein [Candidatus Omnitrophica bacterium]|nr:formylglycine-generating enzyme family protein [Candidatus Omnitrophota bacterium]
MAQTPTPTSTPGSADMDGNGCIDSKDLVLFITDWCAAAHAKSASADLNGNGVIDPDDFFLFILAWQKTGNPTPTATSSPTDTSNATPTPSPTIPTGSIEMVTIPAGSFVMGNSGAERDHFCQCIGGPAVACVCEEPSHTVTFDYSFRIGKYELTNAQYVEALNFANSHGYLRNATNELYDGGRVYQNGRVLTSADAPDYNDIVYRGAQFLTAPRNNESMTDHPVNGVTWYGAVAVCNWLSEMSGLPLVYDLATWTSTNRQGGGYRLPSESEWEYACRGSALNPHRYDPFSFGDDPAVNLDSCGPSALLSANMVWCDDGISWTVAVGSRLPNDFGLYDMHGNVWEWCEDWFHNSYADAPVDGSPQLVQEEWRNFRVRRGGCHSNHASRCRSASRNYVYPGTWDFTFGLRVARAVSP